MKYQIWLADRTTSLDHKGLWTPPDIVMYVNHYPGNVHCGVASVVVNDNVLFSQLINMHSH